MNTLRERPRAAGALVAAVLTLVAVAMLAGGALTGGEESPPAADPGRLARVERAAAASARQLTDARATLRAQQADLRAARGASTAWRKRAVRAERRLRASTRRVAKRRGSGRRNQSRR